MAKLRDTRNDTDDSAERLSSLDATRGVFLLLLISSGFGLLNREMLDQERWGWITKQWAHRDWEGCALWDLLQPALLFIVGVAMPYAYANRQAKGQGWPRQFVHALLRATILVLLGIYLDSYRADRLVFDLRGDLQQIGLAYLIAFLFVPLGMSIQGVTVAFLLIGHTAGYVIYAFAGGHDLWSKTQNLGTALDVWLHFDPHPQLYTTINTVPAAAMVLIGILIGGLTRSGLTAGNKVAIMTGFSLVGILFGWVLSGGGGWIDLSWFAVLPMIKRIETWTFVFNAVGWTLLVFTYVSLLMDGFGLRGWAVPLSLAGRNALLLYLAFTLFRGWAEKSAQLVLPAAPTTPPIVGTLRPLFIDLIVMAIFWLFCFWLYRRRIYFKV